MKKIIAKIDELKKMVYNKNYSFFIEKLCNLQDLVTYKFNKQKKCNCNKKDK